MTTQTTTWPEAVIARYLTVGGATVDLTHDTLYLSDTEPNVSVARCGGCAAFRNVEWGARTDRYSNGSNWADSDARTWAQEHAEKCRALPKPTT
ncbi:hypothetical protein OG978_33710 [Streptomyces sp. NBC_01591]|uniref:hypothetical protein n=1 Tax=Streptomyces sp. NBC_01591 TaxID=2975888 RepID=UPI002DD96D0C|nr:hypothetical protein [Streptomyces sp. NBC_01591]WSD71919.1 hypothetical protein OG978_33710 [Streptomyces sp. NBC_01591]